MFFLLSGVMASGKSTMARLLTEHLRDVECRDGDEIYADTSDGRATRLEIFVRQAVAAQARGDDFLLADHAPLGELLACPSAPKLDGIAACLLDCSDRVRAARYQARGVDPQWAIEPQLSWAAWQRRHARDPRWPPGVIDHNGPPTHRYDRWRTWSSDDPRWRVYVLDTSELTVAQTLPILIEWVQLARARPSLLNPTTGWWDASGEGTAS
jgi:hypothetical protein